MCLARALLAKINLLLMQQLILSFLAQNEGSPIPFYCMPIKSDNYGHWEETKEQSVKKIIEIKFPFFISVFPPFSLSCRIGHYGFKVLDITRWR